MNLRVIKYLNTVDVKKAAFLKAAFPSSQFPVFYFALQYRLITDWTDRSPSASACFQSSQALSRWFSWL